MRVVAIGDVGVVDDMMHIGDEAMFQAAVGELDQRGASVIGVSSAPIDTAARYGIDAVAPIGFRGLDQEASEARLAAVLELARGRDSPDLDHAARAVVDAVAASDGVLIAGGGNLASTWPLHVYERAALAGIAGRLGRPVVVSGQTFGPDLRGRHRDLVAELIGAASLVGVREATSSRLAGELGVSARLGVDDASFIGESSNAAASADAWSPDAAAERTGVLVSLSLSLGGAPRAETVGRVAALVDAAADTVGGPVRFHAHFGPLTGDTPRGDALLHEEVRERMRMPSIVVPTGEVTAAASLARSSALLITGRYHPAVFAAPAGVPVLGLVTDDYTAVKQRGALGHWGQDATVRIDAADTDGRPRLQALWDDRHVIANGARTRWPQHRAEAGQWWDAVAAALS